MADNDSQIDLKKRARRRLVGSAALALAAVIVLPMVMDHEPRQTVPDVQIRLPSQEGGNFTSRVITGKAPAPSQPVAGTVAEEAVVPEVDDGAHHKDDADMPPPLLKPGQELLPPSRLKQEAVKASPPKPEPLKKAEARPEPAKKPESKPEPPKKADAKSDVKKSEVKLEAKSDPKQKERERDKEKEKAEADKAHADAERAKALLSGGAPKEPSAGGAHVVSLGAYREAANVTSLRAKLKAEGYASYVEPLGDKIRVRAGPFPSKAAADKAAARISKILGVPASVASKP
jgi:DedD protein